MAEKLKVEFELDSEKKHSWKLDSISKNPAVTSLYLMKLEVPNKPSKVTITIDVE
jgi:hypothetical protein